MDKKKVRDLIDKVRSDLYKDKDQITVNFFEFYGIVEECANELLKIGTEDVPTPKYTKQDLEEYTSIDDLIKKFELTSTNASLGSYVARMRKNSNYDVKLSCCGHIKSLFRPIDLVNYYYSRFTRVGKMKDDMQKLRKIFLGFKT